MPFDPEKMSGVLEAWDLCAKTLSSSIENRDRALFMSASEEGRRCFEVVSEIVSSAKSPELEPYKARIEKIASHWLGAVRGVPEWLADTEIELESVRARREIRRKLGGAYSAKSGSRKELRLSVKVK